MFCRKCGNQVQDGHKFCTKCGTPIVAPKLAAEAKPVAETKPMAEEKPEAAQKPAAAPAQKKEAGAGTTSRKPKRNTVLWIVLAILGIVLVAVVIVFVVRGISSKTSEKEQIKTEREKEEEEKDELKEKEDEKELEKSEDAAEAPAQADVPSLLLERLEEYYEEYGGVRSDAGVHYYDICKSTPSLPGYVGVQSYLIKDISGDNVEDLIVVYNVEEGGALFADIYTVENNQAVVKMSKLPLMEEYEYDRSISAVYLKEHDGRYQLVAEVSGVVYLYADGAINRLCAYDCSEHSYKEVAEFSYTGSDSDDEIYQRYMDTVEKLGLNNSGMELGLPFVLQDFEVTGILGIMTDYNDALDWGELRTENMKNSVYGFMQSYQLTNKNGDENQSATAEFLAEYRTYDFMEEVPLAADASGDFIFPNSSTERLTHRDLALIADDATLLAIARNEIYARYGYEFTTNQTMIDYFTSKDWYEPRTTDQQSIYQNLSDIEKDNIELIKEYEAALSE